LVISFASLPPLSRFYNWINTSNLADLAAFHRIQIRQKPYNFQSKAAILTYLRHIFYFQKADLAFYRTAMEG
jgi:hypothetical protein